jgi:eukaryotic-like serine/threonine-protein kinase
MDVADGASDAWDIWAIDPRDPATARPLVQTSFSEHGARLSPDGRWIAYVSDASGTPEVYVARFRPPGTPVRISRGGGTRPRWRKDGAELFFVSADGTLMSAIVGSGSTLVVREPAPLFRLAEGNTVFEVVPDGTRMLVTRTARAAVPAPLAFVRDWQAALGR